MPSNNSVTNLFLILQNYLKPFQTWSPPSSPNYCKPLGQSECRDKQKILPPTGEKGHSSNENTFPNITIPHATHLMRMQN